MNYLLKTIKKWFVKDEIIIDEVENKEPVEKWWSKNKPEYSPEFEPDKDVNASQALTQNPIYVGSTPPKNPSSGNSGAMGYSGAMWTSGAMGSSGAYMGTSGIRDSGIKGTSGNMYSSFSSSSTLSSVPSELFTTSISSNHNIYRKFIIPVGDKTNKEAEKALREAFNSYYNRDWMTEILHNEKPVERIYSDIDPFGEENWDN